MADSIGTEPDLSGRTLGEFALLEKIGQGGYSAVYRAAQPLLERHVVVKVLRTHDDIAEQRFLREARLASRFEHPFVAHIYAFGVDEGEGWLWIAMELVQGVTLSSWIGQHGPMPLEQFVPFFECIADAVQAAHECGIVHRDLKPSNVMVMECGIRRFPRLLDFGIAKIMDQISDGSPAGHHVDDEASRRRDTATTVRIRSTRLAVHRTVTGSNQGKKHRITRTGTWFGSHPYMSPEQWSDASNVGPASDVYSLGIVVYEVLTGRLPYTGRNSGEFYQAHRSAAPPKLGAGFPRDLDRIIGRALAKRPEDRYRSPLAMAAELREALQTQPRERLRSLARVWNDSARSSALLLRGGELLHTPMETIGELERVFVTASRRYTARLRRGLVALSVVVMMALLLYYFVMQAQMSDRAAIESDVEQGRQALLHGESSEAVRHLEQAYQRGEHSPGVAFMLARALQPRMSELARFTSNSGRMWSAVFAPDDKRVLTADDKSAQMWDAKSGQLLFTMSHGDTVYRAEFSPDGSRIITAGGDDTVRIWNAMTGAPIRELTHRGPVATRWRYYAVALSSRFVAAIDMMGRTAHVWDAETGMEIAELDNDASRQAALAFSPDGHWLVTSGGDDVRIFETLTWRRVSTIAGPRVRSLSFDPSGSRLVVGTYDGVASVWGIPGGERVRCLRGAGPSVDAVAFSRDGQLVATASRDGTEQVWDVASGGLQTQFNSHHGKIYAVEFSRADDLILSAGADGAAVVSNVTTGMPVARLEGPSSLVIAAHFDSASRRVVGASWDGTARVWDATSPYRRWNSAPIGAACDTAESLVPDHRFIALSCRNRGTYVWDTARDELLAELPSVNTVRGDSSPVLPALTASGDRAAIARGNAVEVYALPSGQLLRTIVHPAAVTVVAFAPTGHDMVSGAIDGSLQLTREQDDPIALPTASAAIDAAAVLADGRVVATDAGKRLRVIGRDRNALLMDLVAPSRIRLLRPSPDSRRLVTISTTSHQAPPVLWDLDRYRLVARLEGHVGRVFTARFVEGRGGHEILTAGADGTARLWDAATGQPRQSFQGDSHFLVDAALAPDGSLIVAGGSDGFVRFWDTSTGRLLWMLQAHRSYVIGVHYEGDDLVTRGFAGDVARWVLPSSDKVIEACHTSTCAPVVTAGNSCRGREALP